MVQCNFQRTGCTFPCTKLFKAVMYSVVFTRSFHVSIQCFEGAVKLENRLPGHAANDSLNRIVHSLCYHWYLRLWDVIVQRHRLLQTVWWHTVYI